MTVVPAVELGAAVAAEALSVSVPSPPAVESALVTKFLILESGHPTEIQSPAGLGCIEEECFSRISTPHPLSGGDN